MPDEVLNTGVPGFILTEVFDMTTQQQPEQTIGDQTMQERQIREALNAHWTASAAEDANAEHAIYADDAICDYPQSGERILGRSNLQALRSHHPGKPSGFKVKRILGEGNLWITEYTINYQDRMSYTVSIMEFRDDGKVVHETQYFADAFEAPAWRSQWVTQEITTRLPGRIDSSTTSYGSASDLESALRRAEAAHGEHEKRMGGQRDENWPKWYSEYMAAEQSGAKLPE